MADLGRFLRTLYHAGSRRLTGNRRSPEPARVYQTAPRRDHAEALRSVRNWRIIGGSVRGTRHVSANLPNQDAIDWVSSESVARRVLAIADGHGSSMSFRSDVGAKIAVEVALRSVGSLISSTRGNPSAFKRAWAAELPERLVRRWKDEVDRHYRETPFTTRELEKVSREREQRPSVQEILKNRPEIAYGSTLLLVAITESYISCFQIGDGDILILSADGEVLHPIEADSRLLANETTSLCGVNAWHDARTSFQTLAGKPPLLALVATDGYANAFRTADGFSSVAKDFYEIMAAEGEESVRKDLPGWLEEASRDGSGDDVTVGILFRRDTLNAAGTHPLQGR